MESDTSRPTKPDPGHEPGLTSAEVRARAVRGEINRSPTSRWNDYRDIISRNTLTVFNALVLPAAVALFFLRDYKAAWAVSAMGVLNTLIGLLQEVRAKKHLDQLAILTATRCRVRRDGEVREIRSAEVVLDDLLLLRAGEPVVADGTVLYSRSLEVDEALLTGESEPVARDRGEELMSGSFCVAGEGVYRATRVGAGSYAGRISSEGRQYQAARGPLQAAIDTIIRVLTAATVVLCVGYAALYLTRRIPADDFWRMVAATVTSMVPQGLVLLTTLALTLGAVRLSRRGALVQRLPAVEAMASVDVVCMDKTGTLTTNRLRLEAVRQLREDMPREAIDSRLRAFAWLSLDEQNRVIQALRTALGPESTTETRLLDCVPFKSQTRYSAVRVEVRGEAEVLFLGAFEAFEPRLVGPGVSMARAAWAEMLPSGLRLLLFARALPRQDSQGRDEMSGLPPLQPLALLGLADELRPDAAEVLDRLGGQGLSFKVVSGDNPETVSAAVAPLRSAVSREAVVSGEELDRCPDKTRLILGHDVFGRIGPRQKLEVIQLLQETGAHVAMIGDGVNDLLPIKRADLGIAMGEGTMATRTVAGLVLESNRFDLLPSALDEGRTVLRNIRRAAKLFLFKNVYTLVLIVAALGLLDLPFPYLPQQVTLLNALTISVPAFLTMMGKNPAGFPVRRSFLSEVGWYALASGLPTGLAALGVWVHAARALGEDVPTQRTLVLTVLVLLGLANVWRLVPPASPGRESLDQWIRAWLGLAAVLYVAALYLPASAWFFDLVPLSLGQWGRVLVAAVAGLIAILVLASAGRFGEHSQPRDGASDRADPSAR